MRYRRRLKRVLRLKPRFGDLGGTDPISTSFGFDRGTPIDRYYIENFLSRNANVINGRVLEIGDDAYTRAFGADRVAKRDVLHVHGGNPVATIVGDLAVPNTLPTDSFDCAIITQTLHLIYDMPSAVKQLHDCLKPGGVLLLTVPGISQIARDEWGAGWFWSLTPASAKRLFGQCFGAANIEVGSYGNVFAATAFLQGIAVQEVPKAKLDVSDPSYPVTVTVRATRVA